MRITENMMTSTYNRNLQRNISDLASSNLKLSSKRQYNHVSEDPATASKAFAIRDQIARSEEHISVVKRISRFIWISDSVHTRREPTRQRQELRFPHQAWMCWDTERTRTGFPTISTAS